MDMITPQLIIWIAIALIILSRLDILLKKTARKSNLNAPEFSASRYRLRFQQEYDTDENNKHLHFTISEGEADHQH